MLKISNSQWVNTVSLFRMVINLYSFWVKIGKGFYSWIPWPGTATFSKQTQLEWRVSPPRMFMCPPPACLPPQQIVCACVVFLLMRQWPPVPAPQWQEVSGVTLLFTIPAADTFFWWKTEGFHSRPLKIIFFLKSCCLTWKTLLSPIMTGFFFFSFLTQSNVFIIILLKMGVFPNSDLALTLCSSVINTASFGSWIASGPFASRDIESDFHTNPGEGRAHMLSLSLWGLVQGKLCDLQEVISFSGPQFSHFYKRVDFQSSAIFQSSTVPVHFVSTPVWLISPGGKWRYGKSSSFLKVEPLW